MSLDPDFLHRLSQSHPFITICSYSDQDYVGIIQNRDDSVTTIYDYGAIIDLEQKKRFLELGEQWWWTSNRLIPINIFLRQEWKEFGTFLRTFSNKSLVIVHGPITSINDISKRRPKRRSITLVRKMP